MKPKHLAAKLAMAATMTMLGCAMMSAGVDQITLLPALEPVTFIGDGNNIIMDMGFCGQGSCSLDGPLAYGTGTLGSIGSWAIKSKQDSIDLTADGSGLWSVASGAPISFSYGLGGSLLSGQINLFTIQQTPYSNSATLNHDPGSISKLGGSLAPAFQGSNGSINWTLTFPGQVDLSSLLGSAGFGKTLQANFSLGQVTAQLTPAPEVNTVFVTGTGLVLLGSLLRRYRSKRG